MTPHSRASEPTRGPWDLRIEERHGDWVCVGYNPIFGPTTCDHVQMREADMRLIAAAPDLLAALKECIRWVEEYHGQAIQPGSAEDCEECANVAKARALLARLEGT
jgi:hypothetical protein